VEFKILPTETGILMIFVQGTPGKMS
jgi:hypothetical protein